ncbi:MAG TPA: hypothetical protein VHC95_00170 [Opitutales bacterium]|nr:hypothetical protein [Opitutales bacterium]
MSFAAEIRARLAQEGGGLPAPAPEADARLERLAEISPLYRDLVTRHPAYWCWVEEPANRDETFRYAAFGGIWRQDYQGGGEDFAAALRRFRRQLSFRAAYREVNELSDVAATVRELSLLAEFVLREALREVTRTWEQRLGVPGDDEAGAPARFCVLALGKLGGQEINFCSDVDLIFFYSGDGPCRKDGEPTAIETGEFYARVARDYCAMLQKRTEDGFLFNVDLRLRPEGESGPLVRSLTALTSYYWSAGQTWERLAFIRARAVAGDLTLGAELLEELNPFRYPRAVSPGLLDEVAGVKSRIEREVVGRDHLERDIKNGWGGIREVEFFAQAQQLLQGGRNPFLQTGLLTEALERLARYGKLAKEDAVFLKNAYLFLRLVENRLQLREEHAVHELPPPGPERVLIARSLGFSAPEDFESRLTALRQGVRRYYAALFPESTREAAIQEWTLFAGGEEPAPALRAQIARWFGGAPEDEARLRQFIHGGDGPLTREQVSLFLDVSGQFDELLPKLARPLRTLEGLVHFGEHYGARRQFFQALVGNPGLLRALALLFDRSTAIYEWLCAYPGIMEELLYVAPRRTKTGAEIAAEIALLAREPEKFPQRLWLYVKAEQVRAAMAELLFDLGVEEIELRLTNLADAVLTATLRVADPAGRLAVIALGKYGGGELALGSDLDLLVLAPGDDLAGDEQRVAAWRKLLDYEHPLGRAFELDLRLRPHGGDGPAVVTLAALRGYHQPGGGAQAWERQLLTRARFAAGARVLGTEFLAWRDTLLYTHAATSGVRLEIAQMRQRIEKEKTRAAGPERSFKAGRGGLVDVEFAAQWLQLAHGFAAPALRTPNTRAVLLHAAHTANLLDAADADALLEHYEVLRRVELALRRDSGTAVSVLPAEPENLTALAVWLRRPDGPALLAELAQRRAAVRAIYAKILGLEPSVKKTSLRA